MRTRHVVDRRRLLVVAASAGRPVSAHHSFAAEFDSNKPVTLSGAVTKVEWGNPHIWVYLDVKDDQGSLQHWQCEGGAPNTLTRNGWSKDSLKYGDQVTIEGFAGEGRLEDLQHAVGQAARWPDRVRRDFRRRRAAAQKVSNNRRRLRGHTICRAPADRAGAGGRR